MISKALIMRGCTGLLGVSRWWPYAAFPFRLYAGLFLRLLEPSPEADVVREPSAVISSTSDLEMDPHRTLREFCLQGKQRVASDLMAGRRTLLEPAEAFRLFDEINPDFHWDLFATVISGGSSQERHCREVILWTANHVAMDCVETAKLKKRVEQEFKQAQQQKTSLKALHGERLFNAYTDK